MSGASERWAVVVADGDGVPAGLPLVLDEARAAGARPLVIAADGGARRALELDVTPDLVVGDGDSIRAETRARQPRDRVEITALEGRTIYSPVQPAPVDYEAPRADRRRQNLLDSYFQGAPRICRAA